MFALVGRLPVAMRFAAFNILLLSVTFLSGVIVARALEPSGRGQLAAVTVWALTLGQLVLLGTHQYLSRRAAQNPGQTRNVYHFAYRLMGLLTALCIGLAVVGYLAFPDVMTDGTAIIVILGTVMLLSSAANSFQIFVELGRQNYGNYNLCKVAFAVTFLLLATILFAVGYRDVLGYLVAFAAASLFAALFGAAVIARTLPPHGDEQEAFKLLPTAKASRGFGITTAFEAAVTQGDKLLLSLLFPSSTLGLFVVASSIAQIQHTVSEAIAQLFYARLAAAKSLSELDRDWVSAKLRQSVVIYIAVAAMSIAVLPFIVPIIYGEAFSPSAMLLYVLLPAIMLQAVARPYDGIFRGLGMPYLSMTMIGVSTAVMALGVVAASFWQSMFGAAWAVLAGHLVGLLTGLWLSARKLGLKPSACLIPRMDDCLAIYAQAKDVIVAPR